ncbi:MAG: hypothetical protein ACRDRR_01380 [Pseudonocardiaceae bacterium]
MLIKDPSAAGRVVEAKLISGIDDHSRYSVIGKVVSRPVPGRCAPPTVTSPTTKPARHCHPSTEDDPSHIIWNQER